MKKLNRGDAPSCLSLYKHGKHAWSEIYKNGHTDEIWDELTIMQGDFCAYCEIQIQGNNQKRHIEHFVQKNKEPSLLFEWANLFGSCNNPNTCGKHKDQSKKAKNINLTQVCKPDKVNPSDYLLFLNNGKVRAKSNLTAQNSEVAKNTIDVFNLDGDPSLENSRRSIIESQRMEAEAYWEMKAENSKGQFTELLEEELKNALKRAQEQPHRTAIEHLWIYNQEY